MATEQTVTPTTFQTGPNDELAVVDVYKADESVKKTSILTRIKTTTSNLVTGIKNNNPELVKSAQKNINDPEDIGKKLKKSLENGDDVTDTKRLSESLFKSGASQNRFVGDIKTKTLKDIADTTNFPLGDSDIKAIVGQDVQDLRLDDFVSGEAIMEYANDLNGGELFGSIIDKKSKYAVLNNVLGKGIELGLTKVLDVIIDKLSEDPEDRDAIRLALLNNIRRMALRSDLDGLEKAVDFLGPQQTLQKEPRIIRIILVAFHFSNKDSVNDYPAKSLQLITLLNTIDPNWLNYEWNGETITRLDNLTGISEDAIVLLGYDETTKTPSLIANSYSRVNIRSLAKLNFPLAAF